MLNRPRTLRLGAVSVCLLITAFFRASTFAQTRPTDAGGAGHSSGQSPTVTFVIDIDGVLMRPTDNTTRSMPEEHAAYPPSQRINYEQVRHGRQPVQTRAVLTQGAPEFLLSLSRIPGSRIVFFSREAEQSNINRLRAIQLPDGRTAYDLIAPTDLFSSSPTNVTRETIPQVGAWDDQSRAFAAADPDLYRRPLEFSREYMDQEHEIFVKHYELIPGFDPSSTIILEDHSELHLRGQTEMPVMPALRGNVIPLPGTDARVSAAHAQHLAQTDPELYPNVHQVYRRNVALNQLFATRGVIDRVLARAAAEHRSIRDVNAEISWLEVPRPVTIHGREYWTDGRINPELFATRANFARGLRLLRGVNPELRLNASEERAYQKCMGLGGALTELVNTRP